MTEPRIYRASSLGYSLEALVSPHLGYAPVSPPEFIQNAFNEGHRIEPLAIEKLRGLGWIIQTTQANVNTVGDYQIEVELDIIPGVAKIVGHVDGVRSISGFQSCVVEIKCMADKSWQAFKSRGWDASGLIQKYKWQASAYMLATRLPHFLVAWNKDTEELATRFTEEPFYSISDIALKIGKAEAYINDGVLPEGCTDFPCPYYYLHAEKVDTSAKADPDLEHVMAAWLEADKAEKIYAGEKKVLREQIISMLGSPDELASPTVKGECGVTVTTTWQEGGEYSGVRKPAWVTKVQGPRK